MHKFLQSIIGIHWPQVIRNEDLWERTEQERINIQIRRCKWGRIGHTLWIRSAMLPGMHLQMHKELWVPQGMRNQGCPRNSWRRTIDNEASKAGNTWKEIQVRPKTERDGGQFPWTYAPQGAKGNTHTQWCFENVRVGVEFNYNWHFVFKLCWNQETQDRSQKCVHH